jgi:uncharacterized surface protein with fasciclin (FAS1) repeats
MKKFLRTICAGAFAMASFTLISCSDDDTTETPTPQPTIVGIATSNANFSTLVAAVQRAGLVETLNGSGNFTVFAPTNQAFATFLATTPYSTINDVPVPALKEILLNHVLGQEVFSNQLQTGYVKTLGKGSASTTNTLSMFINTQSGVRINGVSSVSQANLDASNGVVHVVDAVIGLPTVATHALANSNFTTLTSLLNRSGQPDFAATLSGTGTFTVFAPTNAAFTALNTELAPGGTASVSADNITKVLQYHVVSGANVLSTSLTNGQVVTPILGGSPAQSFTINLTPARITDIRSRVSNIVAVDVQCSNGVIHVLDKVLLPNF